MHIKIDRLITTAVALCTFASSAHAGDPIVVTTQQGSTGGIEAHSTNLLNTTRALIDGDGQYRSLSATAGHTSDFTIGGKPNILRIAVDPAGGVTLSNPRVGYSHTFSANSATGSTVSNAIKQNANGEFPALQRSVDQYTGIGVADGNPHAVTAILADDAYTQFGLNPALPAAPTYRLGNVAIGATGGGGFFRTGGLNGNFADLDLTFGLRFGDRVGLVFSNLFEYEQVSGDSRYLGGSNVGLPITIFHDPARTDSGGGSGIAWQVTPFGTSGGGGDPELVLGGGVAGGGINSVVRLINGPFSLAFIDQGEYLTGFDINVDNYHFDDKVDQYVIKNGLLGAYTTGGGLFVDAGFSYTDFLRAAGVRDYLTPTLGAGIAWGSEHESNFRVAYEGDFGKDYSSEGLSLQLRIGF